MTVNKEIKREVADDDDDVPLIDLSGSPWDSFYKTVLMSIYLKRDL